MAVAGILKETLRESDIIARIGGDEFAVLAMRSQRGGERALLGRLEDRIRAHNLGHARRLRLSLSMGVVRYDPKRITSLEEFLAQADYNMYQQKRARVTAVGT